MHCIYSFFSKLAWMIYAVTYRDYVPQPFSVQDEHHRTASKLFCIFGYPDSYQLYLFSVFAVTVSRGKELSVCSISYDINTES